jgi:hypothetical protein
MTDDFDLSLSPQYLMPLGLTRIFSPGCFSAVF